MKKKYIFLSYSRTDTKFAKQIADDLINHGFDVWMDQSHIPGGKHWDNDIEKALKNSFVVVLIVSHASVASENVKDEVVFAKKRNIHIIPVVHQEAETPLGWDRLQWIELHKDYHSGLNELVESIEGAPLSSPSPFKFQKVLKIIFYIAVALSIVGLVVFFLNNNSKQTQSTDIKSTKIYKGNSIVIGNGNSDINITQE